MVMILIIVVKDTPMDNIIAMEQVPTNILAVTVDQETRIARTGSAITSPPDTRVVQVSSSVK
jgi:hypothetical protein